MNDFSSPIIDQLIPNKTIPKKLNANLYDKFINGHFENIINNPIISNKNNNTYIKPPISFNSNNFQYLNSLEGIYFVLFI